MTTESPVEEFGFERVRPGEKQARVRSVFDSVASRYDLMNDLMSAGVHRLWKKTLLDRLAPRPGHHLVDMAGGTGDIALGFLRRAEEWSALNPDRPCDDDRSARATICDINFEMLRAGQPRRDAAPFARQLSRVCGNAEAIPLKGGSVDAYTIGFGIRNVTDRRAALEEAYRVLKIGGRFVCLEFSHMVTGGLQSLYDAYSFNVIPPLGALVTGDRESYQYLVESIRRFPAQDAFAREIEAAGFSQVRYENLSGGVAALHLGWRL